LTIEDLEDVTERLAITNYFKHSLWRRPPASVNDGHERDLNPDGLRREEARAYADTTYEWLVRPELELLMPRVVLSLKGHCLSVLKRVKQDYGYMLWSINDPAWILRGGGGRLVSNGSWGRAAADATTPVLDKLVAGYCKQIAETDQVGYRSKLDAIAIYLKYYYSRFTANG
jgi:hypothetical protein